MLSVLLGIVCLAIKDTNYTVTEYYCEVGKTALYCTHSSGYKGRKYSTQGTHSKLLIHPRRYQPST